MPKITIAIDGYSSCGKSTIAKGLALKLGYIYIDSGAMYRAVTLYCIQNNIIKNGIFNEQQVLDSMNHIHLEFSVNPSTHVSEIVLNGKNVEKEIRGLQVADYVSPISALKGVRGKIVTLQREFGKNKGIVMDGRDIGTNVFPDAELKIFMTADETIRSQRRWKELSEKGLHVSAEEIRKNLSQRDYDDTHRQHNPLTQAKDAVLLDNSSMSINDQLDFVLKLAKERKAN